MRIFSLVLLILLPCSNIAICQSNSSGIHGGPVRAGTNGVSYLKCRPVTQGPLEKVFSFRPYLGRMIENLPGEHSALQACGPIGDFGTCLTAAHATHDLGLKFDCLRSDMAGSAPQPASNCPAGTGSKKMNLRHSIAHLRPDVDSKEVVKTAKHQAGGEVCLL